MIAVVVQILLLALIVYILLTVLGRRNPLGDIPGPTLYPLIGNVFQLDMKRLFVNLTDLGKQYGGIFKIHLFNKPVVVVNDQCFIHDVLVKQSAAFAGRPYTYRWKLSTHNLSEIAFTDVGPECHGRRKAVQSYLKQFGSGIQRLEDVTQTATDDLITRIAEQHGSAIDTHDSFVQCVMDVIAILLTSETFSAETINEVKSILGSQVLGSGAGIFLDWFPFIRYFGNKTYKQIQTNVGRIEMLSNEWLRKKPVEGFINFMQTMSEDDRRLSFLNSEASQQHTGWVFLSAGVSTTSATLDSLVNVLCHYPDVQKKLHEEIMDVIGPARYPTLKDQKDMPYLRATVLEINRFASVVPFAIPHKAMRTCKLDKYTIPKDTEIWVNLWAMHHDEKLWDEPFTFKPERFLDSNGQLVPADHPNRRNVMPFGAGHRVCVGEVFALSRLFLIIARILQNFTILPESTLENQPSCDPRIREMGLSLHPPPFKIRLISVSD